MNKRKLSLLPLPLFALATAAAAQDASPNDRFLRYPDICGPNIVFSFAGDLWLQAGQSGEARKLTSSAGPEYFAKFSPDCSQIAFTGKLDGDDQVYVMPANGGEARRLTGEPARKAMTTRWGSDNQVVGWSPDGTAVLFRSMRSSPLLQQSNLYTVTVAGRAVKPVGMARAGMGVFSDNGDKIVYSPWSRDFRTWKHYRGGWAQDLWIFDKSSENARQLTKTDATERDPMWTPQGIFFLSDRNGAMNLFRQNPASPEAVQLTHHEDDAMWASADRQGNIVYEVGGRIWRYDFASGQTQQQNIRVSSDVMQARQRFTSLADKIESFSPSPDGERALVVARGELLSVGVDGKPTTTLTSSSDAHDREAAMSADNRWVAFISDRGGEEELWIVPASGGEARQITKGNRNRFSRPSWSPDGKRIAMSGKDGAIYIVNVATGAMREMARSGSVFIRDYSWSPNSRYLAYSHYGSNDMGQIKLLDVTTGQSFASSDPMYNSYDPLFSSDGNYLYHITERAFSTRYNGREWNFHVPRNRSVVVVPLHKDLPDPFAAGADADADRPKVIAAIDMDDLPARTMRTPIPNGDIDGLTVTKDDIIYATSIRVDDDEKYQLNAYSFEKKESRTIGTPVDGYSMRPGNVAVITRKAKDYALVDTASAKSKPVPTDRLAGTIEPRREWAEVFDEVCRRYRDFYYVQNMHALDWSANCARYRKELPRIGSRGDLTELIGRMVSELNVGHAYIDGRDELQEKVPSAAALGSVMAFDEAKQRWQITKIYPGDPVDPAYFSPLGAVANRVRVGDWLLSIDGITLNANMDPYQALIGKADKEVELVIARDGEANPRTVVVKPAASQERLIYLAWSEQNRKLVDKLSGGRIGYLHIPAMSPQGLADFARGYFSQIRKDGLIVDIRSNGGGSGSPLIIDRLARPFLTTGQIKGLDYPTTYPWGGFTEVFTGKMALLVNESTMSDGDTMAYEWRKLNLGPIYGKRTWGGTVGTGSTGPIIDGSETNVPQYALAGTDGSWIVEGSGVTPDVDIGFDAEAKLGGDDPQLAEAARLLQNQIVGTPGTLPKGAPGPDKRVPSGAQ